MDFKKLGDFKPKFTPKVDGGKISDRIGDIKGPTGPPGPPKKPAGNWIKRHPLFDAPPFWNFTFPIEGKDGDIDRYDEEQMRMTIRGLDFSGDGIVDSKDVATLSRYLLGLQDLDGDGKVDEKDNKIRLSIGSLCIRGGGGDVNKDGKIDDKDLEALLKKIQGLDLNKDGKVNELDCKQIKNMIKQFDLSGDGKVDSKDVELLSRFILGDRDIDGDGEVTLGDMLARMAIASTADINKDGKVDFKDLQMLVENIRKGDFSKELTIKKHPQDDPLPPGIIPPARPGDKGRIIPLIIGENVNGVNKSNMFITPNRELK